MRRRLFPVALLAALAAVGSTALAPVVAGAAVVRPDAVPCPAEIVIGAVGGWETPGNGISGMGDRVSVIVRAAATYLPPSPQAQYIALPYNTTLDPLEIQSTEADGARMLENQIANSEVACPTARIGLVGYSKGAMVVHDAIDPLDQWERDRIRAVVLIGDPYLDPNTVSQPSIPFSDPSIPNSVPQGGLADRKALPADINSRTVDLCIETDPVCDDPGGTTPYNLVVAAMGSTVHESYQFCCAGTNEMNVLGGYLARTLRSGPAPGAALGALWHDARFSGGTWQGWNLVQGANGASVFQAAGESAAGMPDGSMQVVAIGNDGYLYHDIRYSGGTWQGWQQVQGANGATRFNAGRVSVAGMADGSLQIVAMGSDGTLYHDVRYSGGAWQGWHQVQGANGAPSFNADEVAATGTPNGDLQIVAVGTDGYLYHDIRYSGGTWQGWHQVQGADGAVNFMALKVAIAGMPNGDAQIVAIGNNGQLYHDARFAGGTWQGWHAVQGANGAAGFTAGDVAIAGLPSGDLQVLASGNDGYLYHDIRFVGGTWQGWHAVQGADGGANWNPYTFTIAGMPDGDAQIISS